MTNPGQFHEYAQTDPWPFLAGLGLLVAFGLLLCVPFFARGAHRRDLPWRWSVMAALAGAALAVVSATALTAVSQQWSARNDAARSEYVDSVDAWVEEQLGVAVTPEQVETLLSGRRVSLLVDESWSTVRLSRDASTDTLTLSTTRQ